MVGPINALGALYLISTFATPNALVIEKRQNNLLISTTLPGTWTSEGCYVDVGRTINQAGYDDNAAMTQESCINYCSTQGYIYAGVEYSSQCSGSGPAASTDCNMGCTGNATEACGGPNRLNLFWSGTAGPSYNPGPPNWSFSGCYAEGTNGRALPNGVTTAGGSGDMTVALCTQACFASGYLLAGVEYAGECWCGNTVTNGGMLAPDGLTGCSMLCSKYPTFPDSIPDACSPSKHISPATAFNSTWPREIISQLDKR
ncbi:hypothetical protein G7Y89_g6750 [Cudoniella acicularis]|uniref:WSC domain-containing protein n=1 Tax=Cudoniella acicularis TaxID=354080 RepID=A0A8H4W2Q6_9HELO|nr:hypothetical protein G7Y89_g6750 [Cudoniella acicularis]